MYVWMKGDYKLLQHNFMALDNEKKTQNNINILFPLLVIMLMLT